MSLGQKEMQHRWYVRHRKTHIANVQRRKDALRLENYAKVLEYKQVHPCVDCGETDPDMLTFDHVRGKKRNGIAQMLAGGWSWKLIETEISKCDVRCFNHHMKRTAEQRRHGRITQ